MPVFGTAGARGIFNSTQTLEQVYKLIETSAFVFGRGNYGIGWDGRKSSMVLARVVAAAVAGCGSDAIEFSIVPTPVVAFGTRQNRCQLGFSVTASHNPPEFSGVKVFNGRGMELSREEEARIERGMIVESNKSSVNAVGHIHAREAIESYTKALISRFSRAESPLRLVVDCATGPTAVVTPYVLAAMGNKVIPLNAHVSWRFSARQPEPTAESLVDTAAFVAGVQADFGLAHDGDGDRLVLVNSAGRIVPDYMTSVLALEALAKSSGTVIISENSSFAVEEAATRMGLRVVRGKIGKTFAEIEREGAVLATEPSKIVDPSWGMWEDGIYCAALIADVIARRPDLRRLIEGEFEWRYKQVNLPVPLDAERLAQQIDEYFSKYKIVEKRSVDGLRIVFKDKSWVMFRSSGTEPKTRIYCEARDDLRLFELVETAKNLVERTAAVAMATSAATRQVTSGGSR
jgi:phosphomannomutase